MGTKFIPVERMQERVRLTRTDSDTSYFLHLLYLGELVIKLLVTEILAGIQDDRDNHRYALERRALQADGLGKWAEILDETLIGPASQHLVTAARKSQRALSTRRGPAEDNWQREAVVLLNESCRNLYPSFEDVSHQKVSLRQWVREFCWFRNRTRGHGAPMSTTLSSVCPSLQRSIELVTENAPAFERQWAYLRRNLSGKYRVSPLGDGWKQFAYLTKEQHHSLEDGSYIFFEEDGPRRARMLFTDADQTDFFLPNGNFRNSSFEALSYITGEVQTEDGSAWTLPAEARRASETAATPLDVVGNAFTNMPSRREGYIKRAALEAEVARVLREDRHPIVTMQGRGGVGKTSLALEVLHTLAEEARYLTIVWFSARDIDLLPQGPRVVRADVLSTEDIARDFTELMHPGQPLSRSNATQYFTECLSEQTNDGPFLFVLDNFETIRDPVELYAYLDNAIRPPNKILITTRTRDFRGDYPIEVSGMQRDEFAELVRETATRLRITDLVNSEYEDLLFEESDGHPYIAKVLLGEVAREGRRVRPRRVVATSDAMLDSLFDRTFTALTPSAQRVFLTLCGWRSLIPRLGLEAILLRPANDRLDLDRAIAELDQTSMVEMHGGAEDSEAFLSVPLAASLFGQKRLVTSPLKTAVDADLELIHGFGVTTTTEAERGIGSRVERMARAAAERAERGGNLSQALAVIQHIATGYVPAWLTLAELQEHRLNDIPAAIRSITTYLESQPNDQKAWRHLVWLYKEKKDPIAEMNARLQLAELGHPTFGELSSAAARFNYLLAQRELVLDADEKRLMVRKLRLLIENRSDEADATGLSRLAWLCMHERDLAAADRWVAEGLSREPDNEHCLNLKQRLTSDDGTA